MATLQERLNVGGTVTLDPGERYVVSSAGPGLPALTLPSNVTLDLNGSTIEMAPGQRAPMLAAAPNAVGITVRNGFLQGNGRQQPSDYQPGYGILPTLYFPGMASRGLVLRDLFVRDAYHFAAYVQGSGGLIQNLDVEGSIGGGVHVDGDAWNLYNVSVSDVTNFAPGNLYGNPFACSITNSRIGKLVCRNFHNGIKFQGNCQNVSVSYVEAVGGCNSVGDFLVKIQGTPAVRVSNLSFGKIIASKGLCSGLYFYCADNIHIGSYFGSANGQSASPPTEVKNRADVLVIQGDRIHFDRLDARKYPQNGLWLHDGTGRVEVTTCVLDALKPDVQGLVVNAGMAVVAGIEYGLGVWQP